jgi:hypothetical protein
MNDKLERIWKEAAVPTFKLLSRRSPGGTEVEHETSSQDFRSPDRYLCPRPSEYD